MWSEHAPQNTVDSKIFPRLLAMSEVLWDYPTIRTTIFFMKEFRHYKD